MREWEGTAGEQAGCLVVSRWLRGHEEGTVVRERVRVILDLGVLLGCAGRGLK